jgi:hypothetical protein
MADWRGMIDFSEERIWLGVKRRSNTPTTQCIWLQEAEQTNILARQTKYF